MQKVFEIATKVSTPLALGGFVIAVVFFIIKQILSPKFLSQANPNQSSKILHKIITLIFILGLVSLTFGLVGYLVPIVLHNKYPELKKGSVNFQTKQDFPLVGVIRFISRNSNVTIIFDTACDSAHLNARVEKGKFEGDSITQLLDNVYQRVTDPNLKFSTNKKGDYRYEIKCN